MKIGCCTASFGRENDPLGLCALPMLKNAGYDYAEVNITQFTQMDKATFDLIRERVACAPLPLKAGNSLFPGTVSLYGPRQQALHWLAKAADRAAQLGLEIMVFGSGKARACPQGITHEEAFAGLVDLLSEAAPIVAQRGITLVVEPLEHAETDMILNQSQGARLVRAVNHPHLRLLVDYYHFCKEDDRLCAQDIPLLAHAHCAEPLKRHCHHVIDEPFRAFLTALYKGGYNGRISVEASGASDKEDFLAFPQRMRDFFSSSMLQMSL